MTIRTLHEHRQDAVWTTFDRYVARCHGNKGARTLTCAEQLRAMAFAQRTCRESLRDIEVCLSAQ